MKKSFLILLFAMICKGGMYAQSSQQKALLQQIAALKIYIEYAQKGYSVARKGLSAIGDFKRGEFNLHADYFASLKSVNPKVKYYSRVADIIALQFKIIKSYNKISSQLKQDDLFHGDEVDYIKRVFGRLIENCSELINDLLLVTSEATLEMKDDERIKRIDMLYQAMADNNAFCHHFAQQVKLMALERARELKDVKTNRSLHGLKTVLP